MHESHRMEIGQWLEKASDEHQGPLRLEWGAKVGEEFLSDELRCQPWASADFTRSEESADTRMLKPLQQSCFAPKDWGNRQC